MEKLQKLRHLSKRKLPKQKHNSLATQSDAKAGGSKTAGQFFISKVKIPSPGKLLILKTNKIINNPLLLREGVDYSFDHMSSVILSPLEKYIHNKFQNMHSSKFTDLHALLKNQNLTPDILDMLDLLYPFHDVYAFHLLRHYVDDNAKNVYSYGKAVLVHFKSVYTKDSIESQAQCIGLFNYNKIIGLGVRFEGNSYTFNFSAHKLNLTSSDPAIDSKKIKILQAICEKAGYTLNKWCIKNDNKKLDILL